MNETNNKNNWLTLEEAAEYINVSLSTIYRYINDINNPLPSYKLSRNIIRIDKVELDKWVKDNVKILGEQQ